MTASQENFLQDRRQLILLAIELLKDKGVKILLPIGVPSLENWLVDSIDAEAFADKARALSAGQSIDLASVVVSSTRQSKNLTERKGSLQSDSGVLSITDLLNQHQNGGTRISRVNPGAGGDAGDQDLTGLDSEHMQLKSLTTGLAAYEVSEVAYLLFVAVCSENCSEDIQQTIRENLEISESRARETNRLLLLHAGIAVGGKTPYTQVDAPPPMPPKNCVTLELPMKLLMKTRPSDFVKFRSFVRWRQSTAHLLTIVLVQKVRLEFQESQKIEGQKAIAKLKAAARRLQISSEEDFDEEEYSTALEELEAIAKYVTENSVSEWQYSEAIMLKAAERLLLAIFDSLEEEEYIHDKDTYIYVLSKHLWPLLKLDSETHAALLAWVHFSQFVATSSPRLLSLTKTQLTGVKDTSARWGMMQSSKKLAANGDAHISNGDDISALQRSLMMEVGEGMLGYMTEAIGDYHMRFAGGEGLESMLDLLSLTCQMGLLGNNNTPELIPTLHKAIQSSIDAEFARLVSSRQQIGHQTRILRELAKDTRLLVQSENSVYSGILGRYVKTAEGIAIARVHWNYGQQFMPWMVGCDNLIDENLKLLRVAIQLEDVLVSEAEHAGAGDALEMWNTVESIQPLLFKWCAAQNDSFMSWVGRMVETENSTQWRPVGQDRCAGSAVELMQVTHASLENIFGMKLRMKTGVVRALVEGVDQAICAFAELTAKSLPDPKVMVPPRPDVTRFKQKLAEKMSEQDDVVVAGEEYVAVKDPLVVKNNMNTLMVRLNSMEYLRKHLQELMGMLQTQCAEHRMTDASGTPYLDANQDIAEVTPSSAPPVSRPSQGGQDEDADDIAGAFEGALQELKFASDSIVRYTAVYSLYFHLHNEWLVRLYRSNVRETSAEQIGLIQAMDDLLATFSSSLQSAETLHLLVESTMSQSAWMFERVLLDGGPLRLFVVDDVPVIEQDKDKLKEVFVADGQGIDPRKVDAEFKKIEGMLTAMTLDSQVLIDNYKMGKQGGNAWEDKLVIMKVLAHRAERTASKFLKKDLKMKKAQKEGFREKVMSKVKK